MTSYSFINYMWMGCTPAWLAVGLHLLLGAACPACGVSGWAGCPACRARILTAPVRQIRRSSPVPIWVAGSYRTPLAELVVAHKDAGAWQLTGLLAGCYRNQRA